MGDFGGCSYPVAEAVSEQERSWAMAAHLCTMLGTAIPLGNILAPLIIYFVQKDKSPFVGKHARESLVFQVGLFVVLMALVLLVFATLGIGMILVEHDMRVVMDLADTVLAIDFGKPIALGPPDQIQKNPDVVRAYLGEEHTVVGTDRGDEP